MDTVELLENYCPKSISGILRVCFSFTAPSRVFSRTLPCNRDPVLNSPPLNNLVLFLLHPQRQGTSTQPSSLMAAGWLLLLSIHLVSARTLSRLSVDVVDSDELEPGFYRVDQTLVDNPDWVTPGMKELVNRIKRRRGGRVFSNNFRFI